MKKPVAYIRPSDGERFTLNPDGVTYSLEFMKTNFPGSSRRNYDGEHLESLGFKPSWIEADSVSFNTPFTLTVEKAGVCVIHDSKGLFVYRVKPSDFLSFSDSGKNSTQNQVMRESMAKAIATFIVAGSRSDFEKAGETK